MAHDPSLLDAAFEIARGALPDRAGRPSVIGICGAQGSGKSTLANRLAARCRDEGIAAEILSIDDLYKTRAERERLAREVHPLFRTRGVPGTHDVDLGLDVLDRLNSGRAFALPRFDKASDDRFPQSEWRPCGGGTQVLILEGWCVGARPQAEEELARPVNALEREEDPQGIWRGFANKALAGAYQILFARLDRLMLLAAPNFAIVREWRIEQEQELRDEGRGVNAGVMSDLQITRFVQHYERLTRHILAEMPARADLVAALGEDRRVLSLTGVSG